MSHHRPIEIDKKTKVTTTLSLQWIILCSIVGSAVWGTMKLDDIENKLDRSISSDQFQEWTGRLRDSNNPWRHQFIVPSLPPKNQAVGQLEQRRMAENEK